MVKVPIACTLTADDAGDRVEEWRAFLASDIEAVDGRPPDARLRLREGDDVLLRAVDLAEREKSCCSFFRFSVQLDEGRRWLRVEVPEDASAILGDLLSLVPAAEPAP